LRIAAISHSCVIDVNQQLYVELLNRPDVELLLIAPERWHSSLRGDVRFTALPGLEGMAQPLPTWLPGYMHFHRYRGLKKAVTRFAPDVLYIDEEPYSVVASQTLAIRNRLGCKLVFYTKQNLYKDYLPPFAWMQNRILSSADHAMVVSEEAADVLRRKGYAGPVTELPHGIDPEVLAPRDNSELRSRLRVKDGPVIGYVGRIAGEKGVWDLLRAARILVDRIGPEFTVLFVGDGPARWRLAEAAARRLPPGVFLFTGSVAHHAVPDYLNAVDMLVLPSRTQKHWKEQFGRVLVEALACGVPLVGSSSGHIPAVIESTGGGLVFEESDATDLADKIQQLLTDEDLAASLAQAGRNAVMENYTYSRVAQILYDTLKQVVEGTEG